MKIALLGHGTVGRGVDTIIEKRVEGIEVKWILELPDRCSEPRMTSDYQQILADKEVELVVECMGGLEPAHSYLVAALRAGKSIVTSNKAVVAAYFPEFVEEARSHGAALFIEATCGGGIPWIASIAKARRIDEISSFSGIMNGTTNYIVDAMEREGADFAETLAKAQGLGYAERDPSADIDGIDVRNKTVIATGVAFDVACNEDLPVTGIRTLAKADLDLLARHGRTVKLLGRGCQRDGRYMASVEPVALPRQTLEANVPANFNLVTLVGSTVGELKFYGQGAGMLPTGNAMVQDILDYAAGMRPSFRLDADLAWDPSLLAGDYVFCSKAQIEGSEPWEGDESVQLVRALTPSKAKELFEKALSEDPDAFMAAVAEEA